MVTEATVHSDLAIPPGEYLEEVIAELGMTKGELARRMDRPAAKLTAIFKGRKVITPDTALQLEKVVGVPAHIWTGLEAEYRLALARQQEQREKEGLTRESGLVRKFCYAELVEIGAVEKRSKPTEKVLELQRFFGVTSLRNVPDVRRYRAAFRCGRGTKKRSPEAIAAWLRLGDIAAQRIDTSHFDKTLLRRALGDIRSLTLAPTRDFVNQLRNTLSDAGVAFVIARHLPRTYTQGATFWLGPDKAVLMMSIRGKWADIFWFSLFHELGHILLHGHRAIFVECDDGDPAKKAEEREANRFAADTLIPPKEYGDLVWRKAFHAADIRSFAKRIGIDPGIVVGRLQHDGYLDPSWHNDLRKRYEW